MILSKQIRRKQQRGIAMIMAILALLLLAVIGAAFMLMNTTENSANGNYKDSQQAYFASRAGLENVRAVLVENTNLKNLANGLAMPQSGSQLGVIYAINPTNGEAVDPKAIPYLDDELCHELYAGMGLAAGTTRAPCGIGAGELPTTNYYKTAAVTAGSDVTLTTGEIPNSNTASALPFKWVRITNKQNAMGLQGGQLVDNTQASGQQVCWDGQQEFVTAPGNCANLSDANASTMNPVWLLTSLAVSSHGSRRMTQMEIAFNPPINVNATVSTKAPITLRGSLTVNGEDNCTCKPDGTPRPPALRCDKTHNAMYNGVPFPAIGITQNGGPAETLTGVGGQTGLTVYNPSTGQVVTPGATAQGPWPFNIPQLVKTFSQGATPATGPPWNFTCTPSTPTAFGACSGGSGLAFGNYPTGTLPASVGGGPDPSTGIPAVVYVPGSVRLTGNMTGDGVLIIDGDLDVHGGMAFYGLILVTGSIVFTGGGSQPVNLYGAILAGQDVHATDAIGGSFDFHYDSCALKQTPPPGEPHLIATHELTY